MLDAAGVTTITRMGRPIRSCRSRCLPVRHAVTVAMPAGNNLGFAEPFALGRATASAMTVGTASFELE
jgi:hypothetical protein